ncbi:ABC transporter ATP-binding protein [Acutalibacter sp. 1XD8-36]|uniref:ABC transporter ATP-binding protein n=1 Tax=Acutalibacter sp. 1XD8-36 TaxID=2320852 RepID=UPI0014128CE0|nr:ABC transporter ATP-binding protein [Acutalibacter sp. 1XD8-36]NBJ89963.1 ABC transporter ATP-binding protein [Acutalibacter sp. 1XD8-36]
MPVLNVEHLKKTYSNRLGGAQVHALQDVSFTVEEGEFAAIMGESGSGKTTLLNILAALDKPTSGKVYLNMRDITSLKESEISAFRRDNLGFVFQDFNLLDTFSVQDNIFLPLVLAGKKYPEMRQRLEPIAMSLGIAELLGKFPYEISGGQKQRVAIARAIITQPQLILADEPTGALDSRSAGQIMDIFSKVNASGQTVLMVTHSIQAASRAGRVLFIKDGQVFHQIYRGSQTDDQMYQSISETLTVLATGREGAQGNV